MGSLIKTKFGGGSIVSGDKLRSMLCPILLDCFPADSLLFYSFNNASGPRELPSTAVQVSLCSYFHFCDFDVESISRGGLFCIIFALFFGAFGGLKKKKKICRYITF